jgi:hypothetical protein
MCYKGSDYAKNNQAAETVVLTEDIPGQDLWQGQVGTVVDILANGTAYEVGFSDRNGHTYASLGRRLDQLMVLHCEPISSSAS